MACLASDIGPLKSHHMAKLGSSEQESFAIDISNAIEQMLRKHSRSFLAGTGTFSDDANCLFIIEIEHEPSLSATVNLSWNVPFNIQCRLMGSQISIEPDDRICQTQDELLNPKNFNCDAAISMAAKIVRHHLVTNIAALFGAREIECDWEACRFRFRVYFGRDDLDVSFAHVDLEWKQEFRKTLMWRWPEQTAEDEDYQPVPLKPNG